MASFSLDLPLLPLLLLVLGTVVLVTLIVRRSGPRYSNLPPGPPLPGRPGGHRSLLAGPKPWRKLREMSKVYGDIFYLQMGDTPTIVLGSAQVAWDLLEKRSNIYSSRPRAVLGGEILSNNRRGLLTPYGDRWRRWRKALHMGFMSKMADSYQPIQVFESNALIKDLLDSPEKFELHCTRYAASVITTVVYGRRILDYEKDQVVIDNEQSTGFLVSVNIPGKFAVEAFPWLKHVPAFLAPWKKAALQQRKRDIELYSRLYNEVKVKMEKGTAPPCFVKSIIEVGPEKLGMSELDMQYTCGSPFSAGVETSAGSLLFFLLACAYMGETFVSKAHEELDRVIGKDRMPSFEDMESLPYIRAVAAETLRWRPVPVLGGQPHAVTQEDNYRGYTIPAGSTILAPLWTLHLNEDDFPEPDKFDPERFMVKRDYPGPYGHSAFGFGRRICPGLYLGGNSVSLNIARMLWAFDIGHAVDEQGKRVPVNIYESTDGFNVRPLPFKVSIKPRSARHASVVEREYAEATDGLKAYED